MKRYSVLNDSAWDFVEDLFLTDTGGWGSGLYAQNFPTIEHAQACVDGLNESHNHNEALIFEDNTDNFISITNNGATGRVDISIIESFRGEFSLSQDELKRLIRTLVLFRSDL